MLVGKGHIPVSASQVKSLTMCPKQTLALYREMNILSEIVIFYVAVGCELIAYSICGKLTRGYLSINQRETARRNKLLYYPHSTICRICTSTLSSHVRTYLPVLLVVRFQVCRYQVAETWRVVKWLKLGRLLDG
jgi:hypothetical protein